MKNARLVMFAASAALLAACQTDTATGGATPVTSTPTATASPFRSLPGAHEFRCPPAGTRVAYDSGVTITHGGALPTDPLVCRETRTSGEFTLLMASYSLPAADERSIRTGMARLWPLADGKTTSFVFVGTTGTAQTFQYQETWRFLGLDTVRVDGAAREALVLERTQEGRLGNTHRSVTTFWLDRDLHVALRARIRLISGTTGFRDFEARRITAATAGS